jgi:exodeoxyribonuclease V alpha subunit
MNSYNSTSSADQQSCSILNPSLAELKFSTEQARHARMTRIEATVLAVTYRNQDTGWTALKINAGGFNGAAGVISSDIRVERGSRIEIFGEPGIYRGHPQIKFKSEDIRLLSPELHEPLGLALRRIDPKISPSHVETLTALFGLDFIAKIAANKTLLDHDRLTHWRPATRATIYQACKKVGAVDDIKVALLQVGATAKNIEAAAKLVKEKPDILINPYLLVFEGLISFNQADALASTPFYADERARLAENPALRLNGVVFQVMNERRRQGHCGVNMSALTAYLEKQHSATKQQIAAAFEEAGKQYVAYNPSPSSPTSALIFHKDLHALENRILGLVTTRANDCPRPPHKPPWDDKINKVAQAISFIPNPEQIVAINNALSYPLSMITGGPGTGKTTALRLLGELLGDHAIHGCAFAARAARNLQQKTGIASVTIHKLSKYAEGQWGLKQAAKELRGIEVLVVDECSMIPSWLFERVLRLAKLAGIGHVVLVGDVEQLPPIGVGQPFADLINAFTAKDQLDRSLKNDAFPVTRLEKVYRFTEGGEIAEVCDQVRHGHEVVPPETSRGEVSFHEALEPKTLVETTLALYAALLDKGARPQDIGVLSPFRKLPLYGVRDLNLQIRDMLGRSAGPCIGDLVMCVTNDYAREILNGMRGVIAGIRKDGSLLVRFEDCRDVVHYTAAELTPKSKDGPARNLHWAYASTVHKAQGGQFPRVIALIPCNGAYLFGKPALYTAFSRAERTLAIVGDIQRLTHISQREGRRRVTALAALLKTPAKGQRLDNVDMAGVGFDLVEGDDDA